MCQSADTMEGLSEELISMSNIMFSEDPLSNCDKVNTLSL